MELFWPLRITMHTPTEMACIRSKLRNRKLRILVLTLARAVEKPPLTFALPVSRSDWHIRK